MQTPSIVGSCRFEVLQTGLDETTNSTCDAQVELATAMSIIHVYAELSDVTIGVLFSFGRGTHRTWRTEGLMWPVVRQVDGVGVAGCCHRRCVRCCGSSCCRVTRPVFLQRQAVVKGTLAIRALMSWPIYKVAISEVILIMDDPL